MSPLQETTARFLPGHTHLPANACFSHLAGDSAATDHPYRCRHPDWFLEVVSAHLRLPGAATVNTGQDVYGDWKPVRVR